MRKNRLKLIVILSTVCAVVAIVSMVTGLTIQFAKISTLKRQNKALESQIAIVREYTPKVKDELEFFNSTQALEDYYRQQGYGKSGDIIFD